jgi:hypothetical protein
MDSPEDIPTPDRLENMANEIANLDLNEHEELDLNEHEELELSKILHIASKRYNLNKESAKDLVEVLSRTAEVGIKKVYENNTGRVLDYKFLKKQVYDG